MSQEFNFKGLFRTGSSSLEHKSFFDFMEALGLDDPKLRVVTSKAGNTYLHAVRESDGQYVPIRISEKCNFDADNDELTDLVDFEIWYGKSDVAAGYTGNDFAVIAPMGVAPDPKIESSLSQLKKDAKKANTPARRS